MSNNSSQIRSNLQSDDNPDAMAAIMKNFLLPNAANADDLNDLIEEESTPLETPLEASNKMLNDAGYNVGDRREGAERCRLKFANLQKQYLQHIRHMNTTGEKKKNEPSFFSQMHGILGQKDKVNPQNLQVSLDESDVSMNEMKIVMKKKKYMKKILENLKKEHPKFDPSTLIKNRAMEFCSLRVPNAVLVDVMKQQHKELQSSGENEFIELKKMMETQNEQIERFLNQFERLVT
ncbi:unnamed protein product [Ceutorhynchus assimilis]|uniref:Uncharacterized protein n=1 Tax=Ceutorhynchus assimilis TaxID=467358 RepID=A0A9N9QIJ5_9CUCU|nr:unnamed protein product [Ceutorhynchus assimilis]